MKYAKKRPKTPTFIQKGLKGFQFDLINKDIEIYYEDSELGHDDFVKAKNFTHFYYVLEGSGVFTIDSKEVNVEKGMVVEIPPKVEFAFNGKMKLILIVDKPFDPENLEVTRKNLDI